MALKVGELFASFNLDTSGIGSAVSSAEKSLSSLGKGLTLGGAAMTAAVTVPLVNAAKDIYEAGSGFDSQMSKVFAIAGDEVTSSAEKMDALRKKALEMGSTTQFTATEAGQAFEYMAMAGWKTDSMLAAIEPLMNLAAAAGEDLGTTSDIVTDAMTAFGLAATDTVKVVKDGMEMDVNAVEYFADILAAASSNSNTNVTMLGESFKFAAPLAGSLGYSLNDVAIALGLMANNGIKSSMAGTSLSRVIQNMAKPSDQTAEAMEKLGLSLYDSKGNVKSLRDLMGDFRNAAKQNGVDLAEMTQKVSDLDSQFALGKLTEEQYEAELAKLTGGSGDFLAAITQIAGARGLPGLLAIMNTTDEDFASLADSIDNATGSASKMKNVMLDNVGGAVTIFKSAVEGLEITLWDLVKEPLPGLITKATEMVDSFRQMDKETQLGALKMGAFAAALGPVMTASGTLLMMLPKIVKGIAMLSSPLGLVSIGMLALGAASMDAENLMGKNLEKMAKSAATNMKKVQKNLRFKNWVLASRGNKFLDSVKSAVEEAGPVFMDTLSIVLQTGISALGSMMPKAAEVATTTVKTITDGIVRSAPGMAKTLARTLTRLATSVIGAVPDMLHAGMVLFSSLIDAVGKVDWLDIGKQLNTAITDALKEIRTNFYTLVFGEEPTAEDLGDWGKLGAKITENIKAGIQTASQNGKNLIGGLVLGDEYNPSDTWGTVAQKIWDKIVAKMGELVTKTGDLLKGLVLGKDYQPNSTWAQVGTKKWDTIKTGITAKGEWIKELVLGEDYTPASTWSDVGGKLWSSVKSAFAAAGDWIKELVLGEDYQPETTWSTVGGKIWSVIKSGITAVGDWIKDLVGFTPGDSWSTFGSDIWKKIKAGITASGDWIKELIGFTPGDSWKTIGTVIWGKIKSGISATGDWLKEKIGYTPEDSWASIGSDLWEKILSGISVTGDWLKTQLGYSPSDSWKTIGSQIWTKIKSGITATGDWLKTKLGYSPSAAWSDVGKDLWGKIKAGITETGDWIKELIGFTPGDSWSDIGSSIWSAIKTGISETGDWLKALIGFTPEQSWSEIGSAIWTNIKTGIKETGDWLKTILGYSPSDSWKTIGTLIWIKIKSGIKATGDWLKTKLGYSPSASWSDVGKELWGKIKNGISETGDWIKTLIGFSPEESWSDIGSSIWGVIKSGIAETGDWIKSLILGEEYSAEESWSAVGEKIWSTIKSGIAETGDWLKTALGYSPTDEWKDIGKDLWDKIKAGISATGDWLKTKIGFKADDSWSTIGTEIWDKIKSGIGNIPKKIKEQIGTFALGEDYDPGTSWETIGTSIWEKIKGGLGDVSEKLKGLLTGLLFDAGEEGYQADKSWADIGSALWEKVQSGITAGKDMAAAILEKIGNVEIDVEGVMTTVKNAGTFVSNLIGNMLDGKITWGTKITDLAQKIGDEFAAYGWGNIGTTLGQVANNLITAITNAIPNAVDAAGNAIDVGLTLATGIMNSIVTAIGDSSLASGFSNLVQGLVTGIVSAVERLPEMLENVLSVGAQVANAIMGSITSALNDMEASGIAASLGQAAVDLVHGLLTSITNFGENADVQSFIQNLGEGFSAALGMLGDICGEIIAWLFSTEGLKSIYNAGVTVANLLKQGIDAALSGSLNFFEHLFEGVLVNLGLVNEDDLAAAKESGKLLADTITESAESELADTAQGRTLIDLMNWGLMNGSENKGWVDTSDMQAAINWAFERSEGSAELFREKFIDKFLDTKGGAVGPAGDKEFWANILGVENLGKTFTELVEEAVEESPDYEGSFSNWTDYLKYLVSKGKLNPSDFITDDMNFWQAFYDAYANNDTTAMMNLLASQGKEMFGEAAEATKEAAEGAAEDAAQEAAEAAQKALAGGYEQAAADTEDTIASAMEQAGVNGVKGFTFGTKETAGEAEGAALQVSDDVVKSFLLTMSQENGYLIGENFVLAMGTAMSDKTADMSAIALAAGQAAYSALSGSASYANGYTIGYNFGSGFVAGIESMIDRAASAAASLGAAGTDSLSGIIREGSPSRVTAETGVNFGLGFINSILDSAEGAADAAAMMGRSAGDALAYTVRGIGSEAAEIRYPQAGGYARGEEAYYSGQQNDPAIEQMTNRIIEALSHMGVYIDGEPAGHVLTPYISEEIAHSTSVRR